MVEQSLFVGAHILAVALTAGLALHAYKRHGATGLGKAFAAMATAFSVWASLSLLRSFTVDPGLYVALTALKYLGVASAPVFFLLVALHFAGQERFTKPRWVGGLLAFPALTVIAVATNAWHGLFYTSLEAVHAGGLAGIETSRGPWFWMFALYGWGLLALGTGALLVKAGQRFATYRLQSFLIVVGIAVPWAASLAYIFQGWPHPAVDPTPVAFSLTVGVFALALFRADVLELVTQARGAWFMESKDPVFILDEEGRLVDENPAAGRLLRSLTQRSPAKGERLPERLYPENPTTNGSVSFRVDGEKRSYKVEEIPLKQGEPGPQVVGLVDITQEHETQTELQQALAVERAVLDATADGVLVVDLEGSVVTYNARFQVLWDIPDQHLGTKDDEVLLEYVVHQLEDPEAFLERVQALYENPETETFDEIRFKDGRVVERYSRPWRLDGEIQGRVWSFRDVTEQRRVQERFETLLEAAPDALLVVDEAGAIEVVNEQAEVLFGYERGDLLGKPVEALVPQEHRREHVEHRASFMGESRVRPMGMELDLEAVRKDGSRLPVEISLAPITTHAGGHVIAAVRDMTERRRTRERLREQAEFLARMNERLTRANDDLRSFGRVVSHDLKEPLRMVNSYLGLLEDRFGEEDAEARELLFYVKQGAVRGLSMIDGLRRVSQVEEAGERDFERVGLGDVLEEVVPTLAGRIEEEDASIAWDTALDVYGDRAQIAQVFQNLVGNAIKFHRDGVPPRVKIRAKAEEERVRIEIEDNGKGIDPDHADELFEIFRRGQADGSVEGEGIGLAVCRKIVERHGGTIEATGEPGQGSVFTFTLPSEEQGFTVPSPRRERFNEHEGETGF